MLEVNYNIAWQYKGQKGKETLFHTAIGNHMTALRDWSAAFRNMITEVFEPAVREQFETAGHGTWAQLAPSTIKHKGHDTILFETGNIYRSFQAGAPDHIEEIARDRMRWGSALARAVFHQTGTGSGFQQAVKGPGRGMPMRKILQLDNLKRRALRSILVRQLATISRREGYAVSQGMSLDPLSARQIGQSILGV